MFEYARDLHSLLCGLKFTLHQIRRANVGQWLTQMEECWLGRNSSGVTGSGPIEQVLIDLSLL